MKTFSTLTIALLIIFQAVGFAATETFSASGEYLMSDYDTPTIAEEIALDFAKQNAAEQAGIYLESYSRSIDSELDEDEIKTVASSKVEVLTKNITRQPQSNRRILLRADIKASVDTSELDNFLAQERAQRQMAIQRYKELQAMNEKIKQDIETFQTKLTAIKDDVKDDDLLVEQERINREFLSAQKLAERKNVDSGDYISELKIVNEAIKINPRNGEAYGRRALLKSFTETDAVALKDYSRALAIDPENAEYYRQRGDFYDFGAKYPPYKREYYPLAIADYKMALKFGSEDKLHAYESALFFTSRDYHDVVKTLTQVIKLHPQHSESYEFRADAYEKIGDRKRANKDYAQAIKLTPETAKGHTHRAYLYRKMGNRDKAIEEYEKALNLDEKLLLTVCYGLEDLYIPEEGVKKYTQLIKRYPNEDEPYSSRAKMYAEMKDYPRALEDYGKAAELADRVISKQIAYENRAKIYVKLKDYEHTAEEYANLIKVDPTDKYSYNQRARFYAELKDYKHAVEDYTNIINLNPNDPKGYMDRAFFYRITMDDYKHALEDYTQAINLNPNISEAYTWRIDCYKHLKNYPRALKDYRQLIKLEPNNPTGYYNRADIYIKLGEYELALADYNKAIELEPNKAIYYFKRSDVYVDLGEYEKALADCDKVIKLDSKLNTEKRRNYILEKISKGEQTSAETYVKFGNMELRKNTDFGNEYAMNYYTKAIRLDPNCQDAYFYRALIYERFGDSARALRDLNKLLELNPAYHSNAYNNRGVAYENLGDLNKALADFDKALELDPNHELAKKNRQRVLDKMKK